jgi:hypothetical protein
MIRFSSGDGEAPNMLGLLHQPDTLSRTHTPADGYTQIDSIVQASTTCVWAARFAIADLVVLHTTTWDPPDQEQPRVVRAQPERSE